MTREQIHSILPCYQKGNFPAIAKARAFKPLDEADISYDYALPQTWLDNAANQFADPQNAYRLILSTTVWAYPKGSLFGFPVSVSQEVRDFLGKE
jgi:hypothetical protein